MEDWVEVWRGRGSTANWFHIELLKRNLHHQVRPLLKATVDPENTRAFAIYAPPDEAETIKNLLRNLQERVAGSAAEDES